MMIVCVRWQALCLTKDPLDRPTAKALLSVHSPVSLKQRRLDVEVQD
jgi:hypothetical protein